MTDLFGDQITAPTTKPKAEFNVAAGFAEFWAAYPAGPRKVAKQQCLDKWSRLHCALTAAHIVAHVNWLKTQPDWLKDNGSFICAPVVYLNQQRWIDWTPEPDRPKRPDVLAELKAHKGSRPSASVLAEIQRIRQGVAA